MKIIYRPAGSMMSVYEALEQAREFNTMEELLDFLVSWHENAFEKEDLVLKIISKSTELHKRLVISHLSTMKKTAMEGAKQSE